MVDDQHKHEGNYSQIIEVKIKRSQTQYKSNNRDVCLKLALSLNVKRINLVPRRKHPYNLQKHIMHIVVGVFANLQIYLVY